MRSNFTRGLLVGGLVGASVSMMMNSDRLKGRNRKRLVRNGRSLLRKSGNIVGDVVDLFR